MSKARFLLKVLSHEASWFSFSALLAGYLALAPVLGKWSNGATAWAFGASAIVCPIACILGQRCDRRGTLYQVMNFALNRHEVDKLVDGVNSFRVERDAQYLAMLNPQPAVIEAQIVNQLPEGCIIAPEDLAQTIATADSDEQNFLFVGKSRSGKTSLLVNAMAQKQQVLKGQVDWFIFNGKPEKDNDWGGLNGHSNVYFPVNTEKRALDMLGQFKACVGALADWQDSGEPHYSMFVVADEVNNQRELMGQKEEEQFDSLLRRYCTQCMSEGSGLWLSSHAYNVEDIGLNRRLQKSFQLIILGRNGKYDSISDAVNDYRLISNRETRDRLKAQLDIYEQSGGRDAIALTNVGGKWRLVMLPYYSKAVELSTPLLTAATEGTDIDSLNALLDKSAAPYLSKEGLEFMRYLGPKVADHRGNFNTRKIYQAWGKSRYPNTEAFKGFLRELAGIGVITALDERLNNFSLKARLDHPELSE